MFRGSIVALITPMHADGQVDYDSMDKLIDYQVENGTDGIVIMGTTGESCTLTPDEHINVIAHAKTSIAGRCQLIAGTGSNATQEAIDYSKAADRIGVDGCLVCAPYYNKPTQEGLYLHYKAIADSISSPVILYNVPGRTVADIQADTALRLSAIDNIIAIKEANTIERTRQLIDTVGDKLTVMTGDDPLTVDTILHGGTGVISVSANVAPKHVKQLCDHALAGNIDAARALEQEMAELNRYMFIEANPIPVKWAAHLMGFCEPGIRLPLTPLSEDYRAPLQKALQSLGLLS